ncbi:imidazole glycerol phosphate synthase subunit HisH [Candidatus Peregrinibacteria bacterium CG1_02_54_53]|nr:MAG: imidazole glycerol phosphate synthase subunit HisH [Candidatus Peregrinibacteria bacterium CG1_02_54_53]
MPKICVIDYGIGNIHSALKGLRCFAENVVLSEDLKEIHDADALVLPGQGAFEAGMEGLRVRGLLDEVKTAAAEGKPILGICLGAQLLLEKGYEFGEWEGLGLIPGEVVHFPSLEGGAKTPHMGWNSIDPKNSALLVPSPLGRGWREAPGEGQTGAKAWNGTVLEGITAGTDMYFIHSFILQPKDEAHILAETTYGGLTFSSVVGKGSIIGCQFHPEKSGKMGLRIIENFIHLAEDASRRSPS